MKGSKKICNTRSIIKHNDSESHHKCDEAKKAQDNPTQAPIVRSVSHLTRQQNDIMLKLFRTAFCLVKQNMSVRSFPALLVMA